MQTLRCLDRGVHVLRVPESKSQQNARNGATLNVGTRIARVFDAVGGRKWTLRGFFGRRTEQELILVERLAASGAVGVG